MDSVENGERRKKEQSMIKEYVQVYIWFVLCEETIPFIVSGFSTRVRSNSVMRLCFFAPLRPYRRYEFFGSM